MKVVVLDKSKLYKFENELAIALQKINLKGYALIGFAVKNQTKFCNIDALLILEKGVFICLEAKGYAGKWTGTVNDKWFCDGKEIDSSGINPFDQVHTYTLAVKNNLQKTIFKDIEFWVTSFIVAPDRADFSGIDGAVINKYQGGKSINVCNISKLEEVLKSTWHNQKNAERIEQVGMDEVIRELVGLSTFRIQELTVAPVNQRVIPRPNLREKSYTSIDISTDIQTESEVKGSIRFSVASLGSIVLVLISLVGMGFLGFKFWQFSTKPRIAAKSLTIGVLVAPNRYKSLQTYLENELIVAENFWEFVAGNQLRVSIDGDQKLPYQAAKTKILNEEWDIAFTKSPMISIYAKENKYYYLARMFPDRSNYYQSVLFTKKGSDIKSINNINSQTIIALGENNSASSFYMPLYDLKGEILKVDKGNLSQDIIKKVKNGDANIGSVAISEIKGDREIEIIPIKTKTQSRDIPGSGVYLSPKFSEYDRVTIKKVMLQAPQKVMQDASYGDGNEVSYLEFSKIVKKVDQIKKCAGLDKFSTKNDAPIKLFCITPIN